MHRLVGDFELERPHWSWRPQNSKCLMSNARLDKILAKVWPRRPLTAHGRTWHRRMAGMDGSPSAMDEGAKAAGEACEVPATGPQT
ncbi:hypothetical protein [Achromobacter xylosoxidans]|uniref:hypothetical protein n=1 Tax=Alcaligenes xylosoxydans xylosoxydans TaxID=85698 RepID=UPI0022B88082|nr:hypothetical protein [Achromobacter xylosoxidans]MCZ8392079.1 hypothetical protein [Achromobacter xylosoxidans]